MDKKQNGRGRLYPLSMRVRWTRRERDTVHGRAKEAGRSVSRFLVEAATREEGVPLRAPLTPEQLEDLSMLRYQPAEDFEDRVGFHAYRRAGIRTDGFRELHPKVQEQLTGTGFEVLKEV